MVTNVRNIEEKINATSFQGTLRTREPMADHTSFRVGGAADLYLRPADQESLCLVLQGLREEIEAGLSIFFLGGGSNIVVADAGIDGLVIDLSSLDRICFSRDDADGTESAHILLDVAAGALSDQIAEAAAAEEAAGAEFLAGLPGTIGGAVWMNARCYGRSISDLLRSVRFFDLEHFTLENHTPSPEAYGYKESPFQGQPKHLILSAILELTAGEEKRIREKMDAHRLDRERKGHYRYPCAGSVFKNDRSFGSPSGVLLESVGLKGLSVGGAQVSDYHANIIINRGGARAADIRTLVTECQNRVKEQLEIHLEPEIRFIGRW